MTSALSVITGVIGFLLGVFLVLMWARFIFDLVTNLSRGWRPRGLALVIAELTYTVTDPPIRVVRRVLPPLRLGGVALDFAWSVVLLACLLLISIVAGIGG